MLQVMGLYGPRFKLDHRLNGPPHLNLGEPLSAFVRNVM